MNYSTSLVERVVKRLKNISDRACGEKMALMEEARNHREVIAQEMIEKVDERQYSEIHQVFSEESIQSPGQFFETHNLLYFYGYEDTPFGSWQQMFLYEIDDKKRVSLTLYDGTTEFDWIRVGRKRFHGVLDLINQKKTGAISLGKGTAAYFNDGGALKRDMESILLDSTRNSYNDTDIRRLVATQWNGPLIAEITSIPRQYEDSLIIHEGAHQLLDDVLDIENHPMSDARTRDIFNKETERFAILTQMARGPLPAYTLYNFLISLVKGDEYAPAIFNIARDFITIIHNHHEAFPALEPMLKESGAYTTSNLLAVFNRLTCEQIAKLSSTVCEHSFTPIIAARDAWTYWAAHYEKERIVLFDENHRPITPLN